MRRPANSTIGALRTPESLLLAKERALIREALLDAALAAVTSDYHRLIIQALYRLGWSLDMVAAEFRIDPSTAWRAHNKALEIMRRELAKQGVTNLRDIL